MDIVEIKRKYVLTVLKETCYNNMDIVEIKRDMYQPSFCNEHTIPCT